MKPERRLGKALAQLSPLQRELVFALMRGEDESADESIAERHGLTPGALRVERFLARKRLNEALARPRPTVG